MLKKRVANINNDFRSGAVRGAVVGAFLGILPGIFLVMVLSGGYGNYYMGLFEVLSFAAACVAIGGLIGSIIGGALNIGTLFLKRAFVNFRGLH
jgi:hypothetical protein